MCASDVDLGELGITQCNSPWPVGFKVAYRQGQHSPSRVWHIPTSATRQGAGTTCKTLLLHPSNSPATPPLPPGKSCFCQIPAALSTGSGTSPVCLSHLLTHCSHTHVHGSIFLSFLSWSSCPSFLFTPLSYPLFCQWAYCIWQLSINAEPLLKLSEHCLLQTDRIY